MHDDCVTAIYAPIFHNPDQRKFACLAAGKSVAEIVDSFSHQFDSADLDRLRVHMVTNNGSWPVERSMWHCVYPKPGVTLTIRSVPGKGALNSILSIIVSVAAFALAGPIGEAMIGTWGLSAATWTAIAYAGIPMIGVVRLGFMTEGKASSPKRSTIGLAAHSA